MYNLLILDESGSMEVVREATIRGFNELVQSVQGLAREFADKKQILLANWFWGKKGYFRKHLNRFFR